MVRISSPYRFALSRCRYSSAIIRISPFGLHVNDRAFLSQLYRQDGIWDKYDWTANAFATYGATLLTLRHELHKARQKPLDPRFSEVKVYTCNDLLKWDMDKLCDRIQSSGESRGMFHFGAAMTAFTRDVAFDFILGKSYSSLEAEDLNRVMLSATSRKACHH